MLTIEILQDGQVIKTCNFDLDGVTRSAMWNSFFLYWDRHFGHRGELSWRSIN